MRPKLRSKVYKQIEGIFLYINENEYPARADKVVKSLYESINKIGFNPVIYPKHPKFQHLKGDTRKAVVHKTFIITFRIFKTHIAILDIFHGRRKPI